MQKATFVAFALCACLFTAQAVDIKVAWFDHNGQDGDAISFRIAVTGSCTSCQGFGFRLKNSWESYMLAAPISNSGNYSLIVYDSGSCDGKTATLTTLYGDIPGTLQDSVDSWKICPPGKSP